MNKTEDDELDAQALSEEELRQISGQVDCRVMKKYTMFAFSKISVSLLREVHRDPGVSVFF